MKTAMVRLVDSEEWPLHQDGPPMSKAKRKQWHEWRGRLITVQIPAVEPDPIWTCGTTHAWIVARETLEALGRDPSVSFAVCEHQIQAVPE